MSTQMVRDFQSIIGRETRVQCLEKWGGKPDVLLACVGGGSNALGLFSEFIDDGESSFKSVWHADSHFLQTIAFHTATPVLWKIMHKGGFSHCSAGPCPLELRCHMLSPNTELRKTVGPTLLHMVEAHGGGDLHADFSEDRCHWRL